MSEEDVFVDEEEFEAPANPEEVAAARKELERRCKEANIELRESEGFIDGETVLEVGMPAARETRWVYLFDLEDMKRFLSIPFERYVFLEDYAAICSYADAEIEAVIRPLNSYSPRILYRKLFSVAAKDDDIPEDELIRIVLSPETSSGTPEIIIGPASDTLKSLSRGLIRHRLSLRLSGARVSQHDQALSLLEKISNSLFFQIDLLTDISLSLESARRRNRPRGARSKAQSIVAGLQYPRTEYDEAPASLYWYAKSAIGMPLLQFLAFYQVIEFYFPTYYQAEANRKIRAILKDPTFRSDRDADLGRILGAIQLNRSGGFGDERSHLKATLVECVDADGLRQFLEENEERKSFLSSKAKGLTEHKLPIANPGLDLRNDVADRIYDIRCKIVHTKSDSRDGEVELLLPFSKEAEQLYHDISLLEFLARQVLIAASTPLTI